MNFRALTASSFPLNVHYSYGYFSYLYLFVLSFACLKMPTLYFGGLMFLIGLLFVHLFDRFWDVGKTLVTLRSFRKNVQSRKVETPVVGDFEDFFGDGLGFSMSAFGAEELLGRKHVRTYLFSVPPQEGRTLVPTFAICPCPGVCFIFHPYEIGDLNPTRALILAHEFGHASPSSWLRTRDRSSRAYSVTLLVVLATTGIASFGAIASLFLLSASQFLFRHADRFAEEAYADVVSKELFVQFLVQIRTGRINPTEQDFSVLKVVHQLIKNPRISIPQDATLLPVYDAERRASFLQMFGKPVRCPERIYSDRDMFTLRSKMGLSGGLLLVGILIYHDGGNNMPVASLTTIALMSGVVGSVTLLLWNAVLLEVQSFSRVFVRSRLGEANAVRSNLEMHLEQFGEG